MRFNYGMREFDPPTLLRDAPPQFVIIGQVICNRFESADRFEVMLAEGERRSQTEMHPLLDLSRSKNSRNKICADTESLKSGTECLCGNSAIKASDQAHAWPLKLRDNGAQIARLDPNVAVIDEKDLVSGPRHELGYGAHLAVGAKLFFAKHFAYIALREFTYQLLNNWDRRIVGIADSEQDLVLRIILHTMRTKRLMHLEVTAFERFQD